MELELEARSTAICVLYDAETGAIHRMHQAIAFDDADLPSEGELIEEALSIQDAASASERIHLESLLVEPTDLEYGVHYAVEVNGKRLVAVERVGKLRPDDLGFARKKTR